MQRISRNGFAKHSPSLTLGSQTAFIYARWCATAATPETSVKTSRFSLDPKVSIARARSLVSPSEEFPATSPQHGIRGPNDPCIYWREHWDPATKKPYYENLQTREVTFTIPDDFPTRFGSYFVGKGHNVVDDFVKAKGAAAEMSATANATKTQIRQFSTTRVFQGIKAAPEGTDPSKLSMKQRIALYGTAGIVLYLIIHNTLLVCIFVALYVFEVDLVSMARSWGYELSFLPSSTKKVVNKEGHEEEIAADPSLLATFITAVALCKMVVPFQLTITLALCPAVAPRLNVLIQRFKVRTGRAPPPSVTPPV